MNKINHRCVSLSSFAGLAIGVVAATGAIVAQAESRELSVSGCERVNGRVSAINLSLSAVSEPSQLWFAYGDLDAGGDCKAWANRMRVADIPAATTSYRYELPDDFAARYCRFFLTGTDSPYEQELTYVRATGTQYVVLPSPSTSQPGNYHVETEMTLEVDNNYRYLFGSSNRAGNDNAFGLHVNAYCFAFYYKYYKSDGTGGGDAICPDRVVTGQRYAIAVDGQNGASIDGVHKADSPATPKGFYQETNTFIFARSKAGNGAFDLCQDVKLHTFKLWDSYTSLTDEHLKFDLVPCKKDGVVGLYNKAGAANEFLASATATALVPGEEEFNSGATLQDVTPLLNLQGDDRMITSITLSGGRKPIRADITLTAGLSDVSLVAACGPTDCGTSLDDWASANRYFIAALPADVTSTNVTMPFAWGEDVKYVRFFLMTRRGSDYDRQFDYVRSTAAGQQYVQLPDDGVAVGYYHVDAEVTLDKINNYCYLFGAMNNGGNGNAFGVDVQGNKINFYYRPTWKEESGGFAPDTDNVPLSKRLSIAVDGKDGLVVDGVNKAASPGAAAYCAWQTNMTIFGRCRQGRPVSDLYADMKLHAFKLWSDYREMTADNYKFNLIPCEKDGVVGLYNAADYRPDVKFLASATAVPFEAGPEVVNATARVLMSSDSYQKPEKGLILLFR